MAFISLSKSFCIVFSLFSDFKIKNSHMSSAKKRRKKLNKPTWIL